MDAIKILNKWMNEKQEYIKSKSAIKVKDVNHNDSMIKLETNTTNGSYAITVRIYN